MRPVVIAVVSDLHCGSTTALCPPRIAQDDGGEYLASKPQRWLWQNWLLYWRRVGAVRKEEKARLLVVINGDLTDGGMHHGNTQLVSPNPTSQAAIVDAALKIPKALEPDDWLLVRGTDVHTGPSSAYEERVAVGLKKDGERVIRADITGTYSHFFWKGEIDGIRMDFAHHGRMGQRPWTKPNVVANLAAEIFHEAAARGELYPHLAVRSHQHRYVDTGNIHKTRVIQTPAWQLATAFIHRISPGAVSDIGGLIITIKSGRLSVEEVLYAPDPVPVWRPT